MSHSKAQCPIVVMLFLIAALALPFSCEQNLVISNPDPSPTPTPTPTPEPTPVPPIAPTILSADGGDGQVSLTWTNSPGTVTYTVYYKKDSTTVAVEDFSGVKELIPSNSTTITGLDNGWTYAFAVIALGTGGLQGNPSDIATAATTGANVLAPVFSHPSGTYPGTQTLTATSPSAGATIVYTLDGSSPTRSSAVMPGAGITVSASQTVRTMAFIPGWNPSLDSTISDAVLDIIDLYLLAPQTVVTAYGLWRNGTVLSFPSSASEEVTSMTLSGTDIYVAGYKNAGGATAACYWKITPADTSIPSPVMFEWVTAEYNRGFGITVSGSSVYVCGVDENDNACYWIAPADTSPGTIINGAKHAFNAIGSSCAMAIFVSGTDVYATGYDEYALTGTYHSADARACYWINADATTWTGGTEYESLGYGIVNDGTYTITTGIRYGEGFNTGIYGQDTTIWDLPNSGGLCEAFGLAYSSGTVYTCGNEMGAYQNACVWDIIPGAIPSMTQASLYKDSNNTRATALFVLGTKLLIGGGNYGSDDQGCYWVNDKDHKVIVSGIGEVLGIAAVQR